MSRYTTSLLQGLEGGYALPWKEASWVVTLAWHWLLCLFHLQNVHSFPSRIFRYL